MAVVAQKGRWGSLVGRYWETSCWMLTDCMNRLHTVLWGCADWLHCGRCHWIGQSEWPRCILHQSGLCARKWPFWNQFGASGQIEKWVAFLLGGALGIIALEVATEDAIRDTWRSALHVDGSIRGNDGAGRDLNDFLSGGEAYLPHGRSVLDLVSLAVGKLNIFHALRGLALKLLTDWLWPLYSNSRKWFASWTWWSMLLFPRRPALAFTRLTSNVNKSERDMGFISFLMMMLMLVGREKTTVW